MATTHRKLDALLQSLTDSGQDPRRLDIVRRALNFKRAWVELAEGLMALQASKAYGAELHIKPATANKLLLSLTTVRDHAPQMLQQDAPVEVPSLDSVDYFSRALNKSDTGSGEAALRLEAPQGVMEELRAAVFEEGQSVGELRKRFNPVLNPKAPEVVTNEQVRKTRTAAAKLMELVRNLEGLSEKRVARVEASIEALARDLDKMAPPPQKKAKEAAAEVVEEA